MSGTTLRWTCPECGARLRTMAGQADAAMDALTMVVREHLAAFHADSADLTNAAAQALGGGWLSAAGHQVELWGGPYDGDRVWCPPGELPPVIGVHRTDDGALVPVRSAVCRMLPGVDTYVLGIDGLGTTPADRYVWTPQ